MSAISDIITDPREAARKPSEQRDNALYALLYQPLKGKYETVAAVQTAQVLGGSGAIGDYIAGLLVIPAVVACGAVTLLDGATSISVFVGGGTTALPSCIPFFIPLGMPSVNGPWKVTTGANVSVIAIGNFT